MVSSIRFGGLASGMDTDSMVKQLMQAESVKVDRYTQQKIWQEWQQAEYNATNKLMANFILDTRKKLELTKTTSTGAMVAGGIDSVSWAKSAVSSNASAFDVRAGGKAPSGTSSIEVIQLAKGSNVSSMSDVVLASDFTAEDMGLTFNASDEAIIKINDKEITLLKSDNISQITKKIREAAPELNVNFDSSAKRLFMSTKKANSDAVIKFDGDTNTSKFMDTFKIPGPLVAGDETVYKGQDAIIKYNGTAELTYSSNSISINGLDLTLKATNIGDPATVTTDTNIDGAYNKIKEFVDEYNKMIDVFSNKLGESTYRDFPPLTDDQKSEMSENDIEVWEQKAKSGLMRNDSTITSMLQKMRADMYDKVEGAGSIYDFGITTGNWRDNGKLTIDEYKLKEALNNDSEKVLNTLFKTSDIKEETINSTDSDEEKTRKLQAIKDRKADSGAFTRVYDEMISGIKNIVTKSGPGSESTLLRSVKSNLLVDYVTKGSKSTIDEYISQIDKRIDAENLRLITIENRYWSQFSAMEQAMSQMNNQSSWLSQQFAG